MICSNCGTENPAGAKFCTECASRLAVVCPNCGTANCADAPSSAPNARARSRPGAPAATGSATAAGAPPAHAPEAPVAERRVVSVLFADLVGFTTLAEGRDAEDTRELLSHYFDLARDVIGRYGGTVEKFIGDAVMAVWGAPDRPRGRRRARGAGRPRTGRRGAHARPDRPGARRGPDRRGGRDARRDQPGHGRRATSSTRPAASSRQRRPAPCSSVRRRNGPPPRSIAFEEAGEQTLKGKAAPVPAWRALRVVAEVGGRNRADALEAPFVGRDDELRLLKDLFHATTREKTTSTRQRHRAGGDRQDAPGVGVPQVRRRPGGRRLVA